MSIRLLRGDCRETLATLEPGSVQCVATSPPYYGLRSYGTPDLVWGGKSLSGTVCPCGGGSMHRASPRCAHAHDWEDLGARTKGGVGQNKTLKGNSAESRAAIDGQQVVPLGSMCPCGAWLGSLGLEPTPELFVEHLVEVFRGVRRVLADTGCLWLNLGDSYSGSGNGSNDHRENGSSLSKDDQKYMGQRPGRSLPAKNLMMMPSRLAMALQADGWILRSMIPWLKRSAMPESVTDRPSTSTEYVFLLSKRPRYFFDSDAVRVAGAEPDRVRRQEHIGGANGHTVRHGEQGIINGTLPSRNRRNGDWWMESWQGLLTDDEGDPLAFIVNPAGFAGAHFATWPPKLVEPMIKAGSRPGDTVLDPFAGAGTTLLVADRLGRNAIGCELSSDYGELASTRLLADSPMFLELESA